MKESVSATTPQKIVWREGNETKVARGRLKGFEGDLVVFEGERGVLYINKNQVVVIK